MLINYAIFKGMATPTKVRDLSDNELLAVLAVKRAVGASAGPSYVAASSVVRAASRIQRLRRWVISSDQRDFAVLSSMVIRITVA